MKKIVHLLALIFLLSVSQKPIAQTVPPACMTRCVNYYESAYAESLGQYRQTCTDMIWEVVNQTGNAWYGYFMDFWQGVLQAPGLLGSYNQFRVRLDTAEQLYYQRIGMAVTSFNQCLGGCTN